MAQGLHLTAADLAQIAQGFPGETPTLREALTAIQGTDHSVARNYPQGRKALLEGVAAREELAGVSGFAERPVTDLTYENLAPVVEDVRRLAARHEVRRHPAITARNEPLMGYAAAEQYIRAARAYTRSLMEAGVLLRDTLRRLQPPARPGPTRWPSLSAEQALDVVRTVLIHSADPVLDALLLTFFRVSALRRGGVLAARSDLIELEAARVTVIEKGGKHFYPVVSRAVLAACLELQARRSVDARTHELFLTMKGTPIGRKHFKDWSTHLREETRWAAGHKVPLHALRHATSRLVYDACGHNSIEASLFLGHSLKGQHGTTAIYLTPEDEHVHRVRAAEKTFGPLDRWPDLPENGLLAHYVDLDQWRYT